MIMDPIPTKQYTPTIVYIKYDTRTICKGKIHTKCSTTVTCSNLWTSLERMFMIRPAAVSPCDLLFNFIIYESVNFVVFFLSLHEVFLVLTFR